MGIDYVIRHELSELKHDGIGHSYVALAFNCADDYGEIATQTINFSLPQFMVKMLIQEFKGKMAKVCEMVYK